jgi:hypothetical protein
MARPAIFDGGDKEGNLALQSKDGYINAYDGQDASFATE